MKNRKIIQLVFCPRHPKCDMENQKFDVLYALCDDGTVWWMNIGGDSGWIQDNNPGSISK